MTDTASVSAHRIVVGVDGSKGSQEALEWALGQAQRTGTGVLAVAVWEWPAAFGPVLPPNNYDPAGDVESVLRDAVEPARLAHPKVDIQTAVVEGHPAPVLVSLSKGAELLVVGSRGHGQFAGMLIGSVSQHCVTNAHCPVVVLRNGS